ncbi:MAG: hypothetical protein C0498_09160 [Anaerolinea sp.]|nr:hypothetical protein [Anaerolinea sp.]
MLIVTDSSVIVAICLAGGAVGRLRGHELRGPAHLAAEVTSTIREQVYRNDVTNEVGPTRFDKLAGLSILYERPRTDGPRRTTRSTSPWRGP